MAGYREKLSISQQKAVNIDELSESYVDYKLQQHKLVNSSGATYPHKVYLDYVLNSNSLEQATNTEGFI